MANINQLCDLSEIRILVFSLSRGCNSTSSLIWNTLVFLLSTGHSICEYPWVYVVRIKMDCVYSGILWYIVSGGFIDAIIINAYLDFFLLQHLGSKHFHLSPKQQYFKSASYFLIIFILNYQGLFIGCWATFLWCRRLLNKIVENKMSLRRDDSEISNFF